MAITFSSGNSEVGKPYGGMGGTLKGNGSFAGPSSYTTGGEALDLETLLDLDSTPFKVGIEEKQITSTRSYDAVYDHVAKTVVIYDAGTTTEVSSTTDLSATDFIVEWKMNR